MPSAFPLLPAAPDRMPSVEVNAAALAANWRALSGISPATRTGAAVKADGYGLGIAPVARTLLRAGCRDFFVAWPSEGVALRDALEADLAEARGVSEEVRIFVLQGLEPQAIGEMRARQLIPVLSTLADVALWCDEPSAPGEAPAALQLETGMNRLGLDEADARRVSEVVREGGLDLRLVLSHLASADEDTEQCEAQRLRFLALSVLFPGVPRSLANSAGVQRGTAFHFDLTRPGIALYGGASAPHPAAPVRPVVRLSAAILQIREARAGEAVGYGAAARLANATRVATVGIGYADGLQRSLSGAGVPLRQTLPGPQAFIAGHRVPVLGRISMDLTLLDVSGVPDGAIEPGDRVEFYGPSLQIDQVAAAAGTISYELLTSLGPRVKRIWRDLG